MTTSHDIIFVYLKKQGAVFHEALERHLEQIAERSAKLTLLRTYAGKMGIVFCCYRLFAHRHCALNTTMLCTKQLYTKRKHHYYS
jgi:ABC-type polar amino acid transport system ATPase subunit